MFVALQTKDHSRVTSIASKWDNRLETLRDLANIGQLICPGCKQKLRLRTGRKRRRHFAHRNLADCPLEHQSAEVLEAKAELFKWLETKYPGRVYLDMALGGSGSSKLVDLLVEAKPGRTFAYWVFDRQQRSREEILACQQLPGVHLHFIHTQSTLVIHSKSKIALTASQRDFVARSTYDACIGFSHCGHLHFLDGKGMKVRIYRGLWCAHEPNLYGWAVEREGVLGTALISPTTGEIVLAEDVAAREEARQKIQQDKRLRSAAHRTVKPSDQGTFVSSSAREVSFDKASASRQELTAQPFDLDGPYRCEDCGIETTDWSTVTPSAGTCVCRSCVNKRWRQNITGQSVE